MKFFTNEFWKTRRALKLQNLSKHENILFCALKSLKKIIFYVNHIKVGSEKVKIFRP